MASIILLGIYLIATVIVILTVAAIFPEVVFFIYFTFSFGFVNDGERSLLSLDSVGQLKHIARFFQLHFLPWNNLLKISLMVTIVLLYLIFSIFINERGYAIFRVINNLVGVGSYGAVIYFTSKPNWLEFIGMLALLSYVLIPMKLLFFEKISNKIKDRVIIKKLKNNKTTLQ